MNTPALPGLHELVSRWQLERTALRTKSVLIALGATLALLLLGLAFTPSVGPLILGIWSATLLSWLAAAAVLVATRLHKPSTQTLAKRADAVLNLPDDFLTLAELPSEDDWRKAGHRNTQAQLASTDLKKAWPVRLARVTLWTGALAVVLTFSLGCLGWVKLNEQNQRLAAEKASQEQRLKTSEEVLKDWKEFAEETKDPELKKLFAEAAELQEALKNPDPMKAMLEMNRIQDQMQALEETIANESIASQSAKMAEALEAFEGMGAMSAALRNQDFDRAADEAEKLAGELAKEPKGAKELRREAAVSEMLATESKTAGQRGNKALSSALQQISDSAKSAKGSVSNSDLQKPSETLAEQFEQENARKNRGKAASTGKQQLDALRRRLQGESESDCPFGSLCQGTKPGGTKPGGNKAGTGAAGDPKGDQTELLEAQVKESATGVSGEGESEKVTTSSNTGSATTVAGAKPTAFSDYVELSQKAVEDESLPLAHRKVIRTYFEKIRPIAESSGSSK